MAIMELMDCYHFLTYIFNVLTLYMYICTCQFVHLCNYCAISYANVIKNNNNVLLLNSFINVL